VFNFEPGIPKRWGILTEFTPYGLAIGAFIITQSRTLYDPGLKKAQGTIASKNGNNINGNFPD